MGPRAVSTRHRATAKLAASSPSLKRLFSRGGSKSSRSREISPQRTRLPPGPERTRRDISVERREESVRFRYPDPGGHPERRGWKARPIGRGTRRITPNLRVTSGDVPLRVNRPIGHLRHPFAKVSLLLFLVAFEDPVRPLNARLPQAIIENPPEAAKGVGRSGLRFPLTSRRKKKGHSQNVRRRVADFVSAGFRESLKTTHQGPGNLQVSRVEALFSPPPPPSHLWDVQRGT